MQTRSRSTVLAEDARTVVCPQKRVSSLETLYRLVAHVGGDPEQCREEIHKWGHGGVWADVKPEHFDLLGIGKPIQSQPGLSTSQPQMRKASTDNANTTRMTGEV
jgi:hypothetical protein